MDGAVNANGAGMHKQRTLNRLLSTFIFDQPNQLLTIGALHLYPPIASELGYPFRADKVARVTRRQGEAV